MNWLKQIFTRKVVQYVVWYIEPSQYFNLIFPKRSYLSENEYGYWYSFDINKAKRFADQDSATDAVPTYDGSPIIKKRTGVIPVFY